MSVGISAGAGAVMGGVLGGGASLAGGIMSSNAQTSAGNAQAGAAQAALEAQIKARNEGIALAQKTSAMSPDEINSINKLMQTRDQALQASRATIQKQQEAVDAVSPQVKAAGDNLYNLLTGQAAKILAPMQTQLDVQRKKLVSQLSSQMGPGFMTSSAGIQALTQFDNQAALTINSAQMNALQTVGSQYTSLAGLQSQGQNAITGNTLSAFNQAETADMTALQGYQFAKNRETNAVMGAMSGNPLTPFQTVPTAGAPYTGQASIGGTISQIGQGVGAVGGQIAGINMFNDAVKKLTPASTGAQTTSGAGNQPNPFNLGVNTTMPIPQGTGAYGWG